MPGHAISRPTELPRWSTEGAAMSAQRTAARRAWAFSLTLHAATLAALMAWCGRPPEPHGPIGVVSGAGSIAIGVVQFEAPAPAAPPAPARLPPVPAVELPRPVAQV